MPVVPSGGTTSRIAVDERNRRWCSDGFEIGCDNGEKVRIAFAPKLSTESLREAAPPVVNLTKNACVRVQLASCGPCTCPSVRKAVLPAPDKPNGPAVCAQRLDTFFRSADCLRPFIAVLARP